MERGGSPGSPLPRGPESWSTQQLGEFLTLVSSFDEERTAIQRGIERAAEVFEAEATALVRSGVVVASVGFPADAVPEDALTAVAEGRAESVYLSGLGSCRAISMPLEDERPLQLVVARSGTDPFSQEEVDLLRGMGQVLTMGLRTLRLLENERGLREHGEGQARENARLVGELRERQGMLERLSGLQRLIVAQTPLQEVLEAIAEAAHELIGDELVAIRVADRDEPSHCVLAAAVGASEDRIETDRRLPAGDGLGGRAQAQGEVVSATGSEAARAGAEFAMEGPAAAMVAPLYDRGVPAGSLGVATRREDRAYTARDRQLVLAFAELANLALNHARAIEEVAHKAFHDAMTGLPNRALFRDRAEHALARNRRRPSDACVLFLDLDGFKTINDSLGPTAGDELLLSVARRLADRLAPSDTIARLGGDEFAILLEEVEGHQDAARAAGRVLDAFTRPFELKGREVFASASVGIAVGGASVDELLRNADLAMYRAKSKGRARYEVFEPALHTAVFERLELEHDLTRAIERDELELHFQPIFDLRARQVSALEALVRWRHPERGLIDPSAFIPLAEETGQVIELGQWVLSAACHQGALWRAKYPAYPGLQVCVNLSGVELQEPGLARNVEAALRASQLDASGLVLEITETVLMDDSEASVRRLETLKDLGVRLVMDDFGTGYSSLRYLNRFPLDGLKVERSFTHQVGEPREESELVRAIADLGRIFGLSVVAEGVERADQPSRLLELGCDFGQGYHFSRPLPAEEADTMLFRAGLLGPPPETPPRPVAPLAEHVSAGWSGGPAG
jgi:diguanylate cyclase (GGDEF)-like protein